MMYFLLSRPQYSNSQRERERGGEGRGVGGGQVVTSAHVGLGDMVRAVSALC
jgi:hypothetical protein